MSSLCFFLDCNNTDFTDSVIGGAKRSPKRTGDHNLAEKNSSAMRFDLKLDVHNLCNNRKNSVVGICKIRRR